MGLLERILLAGFERQIPEHQLWIRDEFLLSNTDYGRMVAHDRTPMERPVKQTNRIGIDPGVYATGKLAAAVLEETQCRFLSTNS